METLVIFESFEGQTKKIAEFVAQTIRAAGHDVRLFNPEDRLRSVSFDGVERVALAAPVHERRHPNNFEVFVSSSLDELKARQTRLISVSLKAAFPEGLDEARDYLTEMEMRTGFQPDSAVLAAGAVRTGSYDYFESQVVRQVVLDGRNVELIDGVREFTDWEALGGQVAAFLQAEPRVA